MTFLTVFNWVAARALAEFIEEVVAVRTEITRTEYSVPSTRYSVRSTQYEVLSTQYRVLSTEYSVLSTPSLSRLQSRQLGFHVSQVSPAKVIKSR